MPRSQRNDNFIDKTFTVIADILLQVLPTSNREKQAFSYYRDGSGEIIWLLLRNSFVGLISVAIIMRMVLYKCKFRTPGEGGGGGGGGGGSMTRRGLLSSFQVYRNILNWFLLKISFYLLYRVF